MSSSLLKAPEVKPRRDGSRFFRWALPSPVLAQEFLRFLVEEGCDVVPTRGGARDFPVITFSYTESEALNVVFCCFLVAQLQARQQLLEPTLKRELVNAHE